MLRYCVTGPVNASQLEGQKTFVFPKVATQTAERHQSLERPTSPAVNIKMSVLLCLWNMCPMCSVALRKLCQSHGMSSGLYCVKLSAMLKNAFLTRQSAAKCLSQFSSAQVDILRFQQTWLSSPNVRQKEKPFSRLMMHYCAAYIRTFAPSCSLRSPRLIGCQASIRQLGIAAPWWMPVICKPDSV